MIAYFVYNENNKINKWYNYIVNILFINNVCNNGLGNKVIYWHVLCVREN